MVVSTAGYGQRWKLKRYELSLGLGAANYFGDVGGAMTDQNALGIKDLEIVNTRPAYYLGINYYWYENLSTKLNLTYGHLQGSDANSKNEARNMSFNTYIFESSVQVNYRFFKTGRSYRSRTIFNRRGMLNNYSTFQLYGFTSLGAVFFKAQGIPDHILQNRPDDVNTEKTTSLVAPTGLGMVYVLNANWQLGLEIGGRITTTDYLDGFKTQWSKAWDVYYLSMFNLTYRIKTKRNGLPDFSSLAFWR